MNNLSVFTLFTKYFWLLAIIMSFINAITYKQRSAKYITEKPELEQGYSELIKGFLIYGNIPWIVMGIGCTAGKIESVFYFFKPLDGNPYVIAFFISVFVVWILGTFWLFFRKGAEMLIQHPGFLNFSTSNPRYIKLFWILCLAGGIFGVIMMFLMDIPVQ